MLSDTEIALLTSDEREAYSEFMHRDASRHQRNIDVLRSLIRSLTEQRGQCRPLVAELAALLKSILEGDITDETS